MSLSHPNTTRPPYHKIKTKQGTFMYTFMIPAAVGVLLATRCITAGFLLMACWGMETISGRDEAYWGDGSASDIIWIAACLRNTDVFGMGWMGWPWPLMVSEEKELRGLSSVFALCVLNGSGDWHIKNTFFSEALKIDVTFLI